MDIVMPKMGESVSEGTILKWHKKKGDHVNRDEIIFEISTDKVDTEIPSPAEGILTEMKFNEGDTVAVGTVVAVIEANGGTNINEKAVEDNAVISEPVKSQSAGEKKESYAVPETGTEINAGSAAETTAKSLVEKENNSSGTLVEIKMPKMGESVMEGTIIKWHKKVGDSVKKDEVMFEISTDKVDTEVPSPSEGIVSEILIAEQETVEVGTVVAKLSTVEAKISAAEKTPVKNAGQSETEKEVEEIKRQYAGTAKTDTVKSSAHSAGIKSEQTASKFLSPLVLSIAKNENVSFDELDRIEGSGLDSRITKKDILAYIEKRNSIKTIEPAKAEEAKPEPAADVFKLSFEPSYSVNDVEKIPMDNIRQKIMQHMINSRDTSVHVTALIEVDMTGIHNFIQKHRDEYGKKEGIKLTYMPFIANAAVKALREYPLVNSTIEGSTIIKKKFINLGIAVAIEPTGLIVPNIKNADDKSITGLAKSITDLADRARNKKLTPDDITNGTFTITNYGVFGTIFGTPIINQPEVAILGVGTVTKKTVVVEAGGMDTIAIKPIMALTLAHDHRLIDGMLGGRFLKFMKDTLESFNENSI